MKPDSNAPVALYRLKRWAENSDLKVHRVIAIASARVPISRDQLVKDIERQDICKDPYGTIASLMTNKGNAYGLVLVESPSGGSTFTPTSKMPL